MFLKIATGQREDYATGCQLDYHYFKETYTLVAATILIY